MTVDELLIKMGLKYEDLNEVEKQTFNEWYEQMNSGAITIDHIRDYISNMKASVEHELSKPDNPKTLDLYLKSRLRHLLLLEAFLMSPEKAKKAIEAQINRLANWKVKQ